MSPRKKATSTQDKLEESLKKATTKKEKKIKEEAPPKIKIKAGLGRDPESDNEYLDRLEESYTRLKKRKSHTALITMSQFSFLLELARKEANS